MRKPYVSPEMEMTVVHFERILEEKLANPSDPQVPTIFVDTGDEN